MSKAGIQSNRGDGYQTFIAFSWALTVLADPDFEWLEIDSVTYSVDDIVIGKTDGSKICCQCKKNQLRFGSWSITDLADELLKAGKVLADNPKATVYFYSRSPFGALAALREYSVNYADESSYQARLTGKHKTTDTDLKNLLDKQASNLSTYKFLSRIFFEISPEFERMETLLRERLRQLTGNSSVVFDKLWTSLDHLGMRVSTHDNQSAATRFRLTKNDLKHLINQAGGMLSPVMDIREIQNSFKSTSIIGRTWCREIGGEHLLNPVLNQLIEAINEKNVLSC